MKSILFAKETEFSMTRTSHLLRVCAFGLPGLGLALASNLALPQSTQLAPQQQRIVDATIQLDYADYEGMQARIKALNDGGRRVADYHLAKAQCWLDVSFHEYTRNDRSPFPQGALSESEKLIAAMEAHAEPLPDDTPLVNNAARLRPDLWEKTRLLRQGSGSTCAAQSTACAEVELVHAGNEFNQQGWRHAKPYVQIAEDWIAEGEAHADHCPGPLPAVAMATAQQPPPPEPSTRAKVPDERAINVLFEFGRSDLAGIRGSSRKQLEGLLDSLPTGAERVVSVRLTGYADRLNSTGDRTYNQRLSERRAATVRGLLVTRGFDARKIRIAAEGDAVQVAACERRPRAEPELEECLLPNRRVEMVLTVH